MNFRRIFVVFTALLPLSVAAQTIAVPNASPPPANTAETVFAEAFALPAGSPDSARIITLFRLRLDALRFSRTAATPLVRRGEYLAVPRVIVELRDSTGIIRSRTEWTDSVFSAEPARPAMWISGTTDATVAAGKYEAHIALPDGRRRSKLAPLTAPPRSLTEAAALFARVVRSPARDRIEPAISGGHAPFGSEAITAVVAISGKPKPPYFYALTPVNAEDWGVSATLTGEAEMRPNVSIERISGASAQFPPHRLQFETALGGGVTAVMIRLPENAIAPGTYRLDISSADGDTLSRMFRLQWETMPASLGAAGYALDAMRPILTDREYDSMNTGSEADKRRAIIGYWRKSDPTPFTTFNETMAEYFRRVDVASAKFATLAERDGAKTERGKIYILYGWPDAIEHPDTGGLREIWTYSARVKKRFVFEQNKAGVFRLAQILE